MFFPGTVCDSEALLQAVRGLWLCNGNARLRKNRGKIRKNVFALEYQEQYLLFLFETIVLIWNGWFIYADLY